MSTSALLQPILHSFNYAIDYLHEQVADVSESRWAAQPKGAANHPAWTIGHLTLVCQMLCGAIGVAPWLPLDFADRFGSGSTPVADPLLYQRKETALAMLVDAQSRMAQAAERLTETQLDQPFPEPSLRDVFPTIRHALVQVLVGHTAFHIGQISIWRRAMGLPKMTRSFE